LSALFIVKDIPPKHHPSFSQYILQSPWQLGSVGFHRTKRKDLTENVG